MKCRCLVRLGLWVSLAGVAAVLPPPAAAQGAAAAATEEQSTTWSTPRTPWGHPDLEGVWSNFDRTRFERPAEAAPAPARRRRTGVGPAPEFNKDWDFSPVSENRASMVVAPPDGRVPVRPEAEARRDYDRARIADSWEHNSPWERCITRGLPGGMFPSAYNNALQILQTPEYVVIHQEMVHETRIISVDESAHLAANVDLWMGDSRGRWEGETFVVETTHFNDRGWIANNSATGRMKGIPVSAALRVVERYTRIDADTIGWEATIEDPAVYTGSWTVAMPLNRDPDYQILEYACHEGNYAMPHTLSAGRAQDAAAAAKP